MFKRMSVLVRQPDMSRAKFSREWGEAHADLIKKLPKIRAYSQNHSVAEFPAAHKSTFLMDGVVELYFDSEQCMVDAFSHPKAVDVRNHEPSFLGHGTGYGIEGNARKPDQGDKHKIIVMVDSATREAFSNLLLKEPVSPWMQFSTDVVSKLIPRLEMRTPPQEVSCFHQWRLSDAKTAAQFGDALAKVVQDQLSIGKERIGIYQVEERSVI